VWGGRGWPVMLNAAGRNRRYRTLRTLQLTKQITLNQRTPIRPACTVRRQ